MRGEYQGQNLGLLLESSTIDLLKESILEANLEEMKIQGRLIKLQAGRE